MKNFQIQNKKKEIINFVRKIEEALKLEMRYIAIIRDWRGCYYEFRKNRPFTNKWFILESSKKLANEVLLITNSYK